MHAVTYANADFHDVALEVDLLKRRGARRDKHAAEVYAVRHGDFDQVAPELFSDEWPRPIVANMIDVMAKHAAAALSPLPIFTCLSGQASTDKARKFASKRTKIVNGYLRRSRVEAQMQMGADQFYTYGLIVTAVEPEQMGEPFPSIIIEDSVGYYPVWDRLGNTVKIARVFRADIFELMAAYPQMASKIRATQPAGSSNQKVEVVKYIDKNRILVYVNGASEMCKLVDYPNPVGRCTYVATRKPGLDAEIRGTFDDLIWVQLARHALQVYTLSATAQAVEAPIVVPSDVLDLPTGPGAIIRTNNPQGVGRVKLEVPQAAWAGAESLKQELQYGAITPEALGGSIDASVVTGKGVQQLMAGYSQQIANSQQTLVTHFERVIELALEMDEKLWGGVTKKIRGKISNAPYEIDYDASVDIAGDYTVEVQYGGVAGLDPNRGLVYMLQARGDDLVSRDYVRRHLPSDINPDDEESKILVEHTRDAITQGLSALLQTAIPAAAQGGADPSAAIQQALTVLKMLQKGEPIETAMAAAYPPPPPPDQEGAGDQMAGPEEMGAGEPGGGMQPGMAGQQQPGALPTRGAGARPDLQTMFASMGASGKPNLTAGVQRRIPVGA